MKNGYVNIGLQSLYSIGDGIVDIPGEILLFDNIDEMDYRHEAAIPFENTLMKLDFNIILMCVGGTINFRIDFKDITLGCGDVAFISRRQITEFLNASAGCRIIVIADTESLPDLASHRELAIDRLGYSSDSVRFRPSADVFNDMKGIYHMMRRKLSDPESVFRKEFVKGCMQVLMCDIIQIAVSKRKSDEELIPAKEDVSVRRNEIYRRFISLVKENSRKERSASFYADALCVSANYLSRVVRSVSGRSVAQWVREYVILEAKTLLCAEDMTIMRVSEILDFPNPSFFSRYFREHTGITPKAYRRMQIKE